MALAGRERAAVARPGCWWEAGVEQPLWKSLAPDSEVPATLFWAPTQRQVARGRRLSMRTLWAGDPRGHGEVLEAAA